LGGDLKPIKERGKEVIALGINPSGVGLDKTLPAIPSSALHKFKWL